MICLSVMADSCAAFTGKRGGEGASAAATGSNGNPADAQGWTPEDAEAYPAQRLDYSGEKSAGKLAGNHHAWDDIEYMQGSNEVGPKALRPSLLEVANSRTQRKGQIEKEWVALAGFYPALKDPEPKLSEGFLHKVEVRGTGKCLDGSWPVYYYAYGEDPTKWLIEFEGGDWCTRFTKGRNDDEEGKDERRNCFERRNFEGMQGGTTSADPDTLSVEFLGGQAAYMSSSSSRNPVMSKWNKVFVRNCDGSSFTSGRWSPWAGDESDDDDDNDGSIFMQGKFILQGVFDDLIKDKHLGHADEVVLAGCSAGGLSVMLHADRVADWIRQAATDLLRPKPENIEVRAYADSGFFLDESCGDGDQDYNARMRFLYDTHNARDGLNQRCVEHFAPTEEEYKCLFAENAIRFLETPVFVAQSMLDGWSLVWVGCEDEGEFKDKMKQKLAEAVAIPKNGGFMDGCQHHWCVHPPANPPFPCLPTRPTTPFPYLPTCLPTYQPHPLPPSRHTHTHTLLHVVLCFTAPHIGATLCSRLTLSFHVLHLMSIQPLPRSHQDRRRQAD